VEPAGADFLFEGTIGRCDEAYVCVTTAVFTDSFETTFLQHAEQLGLQRRGDFSYLVQQQGATGGALDASDTISIGARERAPDVAEHFALEQVVGN